jgi:hypothetical protein
MNATYGQYNFYGSFTRLFLMKGGKMLIPFHTRLQWKMAGTKYRQCYVSMKREN